MPRFYCPQLAEVPAFTAPEAAAPGAVATLDAEESHHARRVLRLATGDAVELLGGAGRVAAGVIEALQPRVTVRLTRLWIEPPPRPALTLAVCFPKGGRADDMAAALGQLGVDTLIPLQAARGVVDPRDKKVDRLQRAAIETAKQSGRAHLMRITPPTPFAQALALSADLKLIAAPQAGPAPDLALRLGQAEGVLALIGPEGGWTDEELAQAAQAGCLPWRLGPYVQRIETAAMAAAAIVRYLAASTQPQMNTDGHG